ncbi:hypothetical protein BJ741DRAFT_655472 [Chytriomyces cf. hyalinus JEL632]|nr:hypothetical protein BJ741DRAFT_655472 [Chytriomyces cf. hyalinus JEL632]
MPRPKASQRKARLAVPARNWHAPLINCTNRSESWSSDEWGSQWDSDGSGETLDTMDSDGSSDSTNNDSGGSSWPSENESNSLMEWSEEDVEGCHFRAQRLSHQQIGKFSASSKILQNEDQESVPCCQILNRDAVSLCCKLNWNNSLTWKSPILLQAIKLYQALWNMTYKSQKSRGAINKASNTMARSARDERAKHSGGITAFFPKVPVSMPNNLKPMQNMS